MKLTTEQAVRISYEVGRDFRDIAGGLGGVGAPWDDLTPAQKAKAKEQFFATSQDDDSDDKKAVSFVASFLKEMISEE